MASGSAVVGVAIVATYVLAGKISSLLVAAMGTAPLIVALTALAEQSSSSRR